jgi:chemotaxis protein methyltransferase CheR
MAITELKPDDFEYVRALVRQRSAIQLDDKQYLVESRLHALARSGGYDSVSELIRRLRGSACNDLRDLVVEAMTTNETSFFRDLKPFEALAKIVLPELIARRSAQKTLRVWCAACSTGQEPYSVAITWREHFAGYADWKFEIHGSDLAHGILERARLGCFNQLEVNRGLPAALLLKYFQKRESQWHLKDDVRQMVRFQQINLVGAWPSLPVFDVVFLRNVLIYFDLPTKREVLAKVRQQLSPDGFLFLGGAETTLGVDDAFERVEYERSGCYRLRAGG